ncbi:MAG: energy transducer TonB [Hyphomonadaceae bacterium]|nr:MAG: TonB protein [Caulobacteraceae bacterium]MBT9445458.1 energy transducer TonB [Hyphomonadaceae bacterium]TPW03329.1 MAG: TonB protein [Alphaproteobacteria bacterium]
MTNAVPLRAAAWTVSAAVWSALLIGAFSMGMKLPAIDAPPVANDPYLVVTEPAPPPTVEDPPVVRERASVRDDGPLVLLPLPPVFDPGPAIATTTIGATTGSLVAPAPRITNPRWLSRPGAREFDRFYPPRARERGKEGRVTLDCLVGATGSIACGVVSESPEGWGFGDAALKIAPSFRLAPRLEDGRATEGGAVRVDIAFRLGG